ARGHFGPYGGRYVPETLMHPLQELEEEYFRSQHDPDFQRELEYYLKEFCGRPTPLYFAERLTKELGGAKIYLKREDLLHTGAHKINNCIGQILLAKRMGKIRIIAETGAGQHGVATATVAAMFGLKCVIYMGAVDCERQALNVFRMKMLGAEVVSVKAGQQTLKEAINEAMRDSVTNQSRWSASRRVAKALKRVNTPLVSRVARWAFYKVPAHFCCRTSSARSSSLTAFLLASITPPWDLNTPGCATKSASNIPTR